MMDFLLTPERRKRFWDKVDKPGPDACWDWRVKKRHPERQPATKPDGYTRVTVRCPDGTRICTSAHRLAYLFAIGPLIPGMEVDHLCNNRSCCNPRHLEQVTPQENVRRAVQRRQLSGKKRGWKPKPEFMTCVRCGQAKLFTSANFFASRKRLWGLGTVCKVCKNAEHASRQRLKGRLPQSEWVQLVKQKTAARHADPMKECVRCGQFKPRDGAFGLDRAKRDGLASYCRSCKVNATAESKKRNPERSAAESRRYAQKKREAHERQG